jgi:hypothetical protein
MPAVSEPSGATVTVKLQLDWFDDASVAVHVTVVVPTANGALDDGVLVTVIAPGQLSLTVYVKFTLAAHAPGGAKAEIGAGHEMAGGVVSATVTVVVHVAVLLAASRAVTVIVVVPTPTSVPAAGLCVSTIEPDGVQLSDAVVPATTFGTGAWQFALAETIVGAGHATVGAVTSATVVGSDAVLLAAFVSPGVETVAEFVTPGAAAHPTATVSVNEVIAPGESGPPFVAVTVWPTCEKPHPEPLPETNESPAGSVSVTVRLPAEADPTFVIASV